jgi:hypothetical protein
MIKNIRGATQSDKAIKSLAATTKIKSEILTNKGRVIRRKFFFFQV